MTHLPALVLDRITLTGFVQRVLDEHEEPSTIIVCGAKDDFLEQLRVESTADAPQPEQDTASTQADLDDDISPQLKTSSSKRSRNLPTLRQLFTSRTVKLAFCPDITHLRAYLATYAMPQQVSPEVAGAQTDRGKRILAILNLIHIHRPTSAYSAQGLNRSFATAVEAAHHSGSHLLIAECATSSSSNDADIYQTLESYGPVDEAEVEVPAPASVWDAEVSILNVTTKSFGVGERGWVGRTVKLRTIAQRWCKFEDCRRA
ncbi:hypothetical protein Tdes44962_MAKER06338 [Teratosphaeria destructans]|uniref:Uncharacterized protein n=1 Tax=Teratosphaeria destructans TaxID=418781 RepID=A0A9W7VY02_9PEZI|nr:hypothetical protein Tdes44962_MAKER06338 [Teratosphaeria destructans]